MIIRCSSDVVALLNERIDKIASLEQNDLHKVIDCFMILTLSIKEMEDNKSFGNAKEIGEYEIAREWARKKFEDAKNTAITAMRVIDELTLSRKEDS